MLQQIYTFEFWMSGNKLYRNTGAAFSLLLLLLTTAVQLTHSHSFKQTAVQRGKQLRGPHEQHITAPGTDSRCFVCDYQLTKDAAFSCLLFQVSPARVTEIPIAIYKPQPANTPCFHFENRGPPAHYSHT